MTFLKHWLTVPTVLARHADVRQALRVGETFSYAVSVGSPERGNPYIAGAYSKC